ncbi:MAG: FAD-binding protein, partial [Candidatus Saganbacteria bacterium]|nr:FAD-binding protein [Candidatus Saganbacteria bacterium]
LCQVYIHNTNPKFATGDGVAMAYRAGAKVQDMEFIQFHPTALYRPGVVERSLLISESVRGEGGILLNAAGERFMQKYHPDAELAPRDIVSRAIVEEMKITRSEFVYLSLEKLDKGKIKSRFPTIYGGCLEHGIDITKDKIPVSPSAHYFMGGVKTSTDGETNIEGLYASGECASLGIHGANRLASNSLLEGLVFGHRAARSAASHMLGTKSESKDLLGSFIPEKKELKPSKLTEIKIKEFRSTVKKVMWEDVGIIRSGESLKDAIKELAEIQTKLDFSPVTEEEIELTNMVLVSQLIAKAALDRTESRGAHYRSDFPKQDDVNWKRHLIYKITND